jgi:hypothetical protein
MMDVHPLDTKKPATNKQMPSSSSDVVSSAPAPPSLSSMSIRSTDTLTNQVIDSRVPETWNEQPPLLQTQRKGVEETTALLKGVRHIRARCSRSPMGVEFSTMPHPVLTLAYFYFYYFIFVILPLCRW